MSEARMRGTWARKGRQHFLKLAQAQFNKMIRMEAANANGMVQCVSCTKTGHWKEFDAGHFLSQGNNSMIRFDERNVHPQCKRCNWWDTSSDSINEYRKWMEENHGLEVIKDLESKNGSKTWQLEELIELRLGWAKRIKVQKERLNEN